MQDIREQLHNWTSIDKARVALAVVTELQGAGLRKPGACLAVSDTGKIAGSISGGCVEPQILEAAELLLAGSSSEPPCIRLEAESDPIHNPLAPCSTALEITLCLLDPDVLNAVTGHSRRRHTGSLRPIWGIHHHHGRNATRCFAYDPETDEFYGAGVEEALWQWRDTLVAELGNPDAQHPRWIEQEQDRVFIVPVETPPLLCIVGASHIAQHLSYSALRLDYEVHICDPRGRFLYASQFDERVHLHTGRIDRVVDSLVQDNSCAVAVLSHDDKIDDAALKAALRSPAFYIGALGSIKTHTARIHRLTNGGFTPTELDRIRAPIGLRIGAVGPAEIAISVLSEIVCEYRGRRQQP